MRSSLVGARSVSPGFSRGEKSRTSSGTRVARSKLQRALYSLPARRGFFKEWILAFYLKSSAWLTAGIRVGWLVYLANASYADGFTNAKNQAGNKPLLAVYIYGLPKF